MAETSTLARAKHEASGRATCNRQLVLKLVEAYPDSTAVELFKLARCTNFCGGLSRHEISRRLPELRRAGLVCNREARTCTVAGTKQMTWRIEGESDADEGATN